MRTKTLLLLTLLALNYMSYGQNCGTPAPTNYQTYERTEQERGFSRVNIAFAPEICLNVFYHIVRKNDGAGGFNINQLSNITDLLNQEYNPHNLFINNLGFDFIDNSSLFDATTNDENNLINSSFSENAINIYLVNSLNGEQLAGSTFNIPSTIMAIINSKALSSTAPHELGHCLNLLHTHSTSNGEENIPRTGADANCGWAGDQLCDTPADPKLKQNNNYLVDTSCNYTGGGGFSPDTHNIMSYSRDSCRNQFSIGQELRIRDAINTNPLLQPIVGNSCGILEGDTVTCSSLSTVFTITNADPPFNWTVSTNLHIDVNNGNSITVSATNSQTRDWGFVEVTYANGGMEHIIVWVGKPLAAEEGALYGPEVVDSGSLVSYSYQGISQDGIEGAKEYLWELPADYQVVSVMDYFADYWQMYDITGRQISHVFTGYGEYDGLVSVRGSNKCGEGEAIFMYVEHGNCQGSGCGGIPVAPPNPIPNSANENFNLDFSSYPEGTYYIFIYDQYSNIMYEGQSGNIDKTVETIDIPSGVYYLHIHDGNEVITKQLIINH